METFSYSDDSWTYTFIKGEGVDQCACPHSPDEHTFAGCEAVVGDDVCDCEAAWQE